MSLLMRQERVYSASKLATEEFPNFDVGQRSAASIARRLQTLWQSW